MKGFIYLGLVSFVFLCLINSSMAMSNSRVINLAQTEITKEEPAIEDEAIEEGVVDVGNRICPVSGEEINDETKATYEYEGKIYNFCCAMCIDEFKKDPQKYIQKIEEEMQSASQEETREDKETEWDSRMTEGLHQEGHHH